MILYKYISLSGAKKAIETSSIGFTHLEDFNDPFECTAFGFKEQPRSFISPKIAQNACRNRFSRGYAVLSLTRQPLNSLMWAHYGDSHQGVVVGIDVDEANLNCLSNNLIPYQLGEVIYTKTKPQNDLDIISNDRLMKIGQNIAFEGNMFNLAKRAFLYKSLDWAYEEEVRVVKEVKSLKASYHSGEGVFGDFNKITIAGRPLYCFSIPKSSIKEVYLGKNIYRNISRAAIVSQDEYALLIQGWKEQGIEVYYCECDMNSWDLKKRISN
ncbi:DUF2971 domain-containing protein [Psychrobacter sp. AOP7-B1-25]|uniref:DUF2971 domain-containing protein n=1 Tax=Psychrobacter sp. AOP7-B1-25 TaxID=3457644 RepID=UPI00402B6ACB